MLAVLFSWQDFCRKVNILLVLRFLHGVWTYTRNHTPCALPQNCTCTFPEDTIPELQFTKVDNFKPLLELKSILMEACILGIQKNNIDEVISWRLNVDPWRVFQYPSLRYLVDIVVTLRGLQGSPWRHSARDMRQRKIRLQRLYIIPWLLRSPRISSLLLRLIETEKPSK